MLALSRGDRCVLGIYLGFYRDVLLVLDVSGLSPLYV